MTAELERLVKVICRVAVPELDDWEPPETLLEDYRRIARGFLIALREPTEGMRDAAYAALDAYDIDQPDACTVREAHRAMIDYVLGEDPA